MDFLKKCIYLALNPETGWVQKLRQEVRPLRGERCTPPPGPGSPIPPLPSSFGGCPLPRGHSRARAPAGGEEGPAGRPGSARPPAELVGTRQPLSAGTVTCAAAATRGKCCSVNKTGLGRVCCGVILFLNFIFRGKISNVCSAFQSFVLCFLQEKIRT